MVAPQRTLLMLAVLVAVGAVSCSNSSSEPDKTLVSGKWKGAVRLDTISLNLSDVESMPYLPYSILGNATYSEMATGSSWPLSAEGTPYELWLSNSGYALSDQPHILIWISGIRSVDDNQLTGKLVVTIEKDRYGTRETVRDSMPFSLFRQP